VRPDPLVRPALGPRVIHFGACYFCVDEVLAVAQSRLITGCGCMDPSGANLVLWIEPTLLLRSGLLEEVFHWITEALWLVWLSWAGAADLGGVAAPGGSAGPEWCGWSCLLASVHCFYGLFD
jgi:hypothetical protein